MKQDKKRIREVLDELGLGNKRNARVNQLSHGQALRIVIARSILNHPEIVLADEPTASLDDVNAEKVIELLQDVVHKNNSSLLITTHDKRIKDRFSQSIILD